MKKYIIFILFILFININAKCLDSLSTAIRINNAIEHIKTDSLFQAHLVKNCSNELTFCLNDSTVDPIIYPNYFVKLFPDSSKEYVRNLWTKIKNPESYYNGCKYINNNPIVKTDSCRYQLVLMELAPIPNIWGFYVFPLKCTNKDYMIIIYMLFDENNEVIKSISWNWDG